MNIESNIISRLHKNMSTDKLANRTSKEHSPGAQTDPILQIVNKAVTPQRVVAVETLFLPARSQRYKIITRNDELQPTIEYY